MRWPNLVLVHWPIHASWLKQIEICFSIRQRKVRTPNDAASRFDLEDRILTFGGRYQENANRFNWKYTRQDLAQLLATLHSEQPARPRVA